MYEISKDQYEREAVYLAARTVKKETGAAKKTAAAKKNTKTGAGRSSTSGSRKKPAASAKGRSSAGSTKKGANQTAQQEQTNPLLIREALMWVILAAGCFLFISYFGFGGFLGEVFCDLSFGLFGWMAYAFPLVLIFSAAFLISNRGSRIAGVKLLSAVTLYLTVCSFFGLADAEFCTTSTIQEIYERSAATQGGGGAVGGALCHLLCPALGTIGTGLFLGILALICVILITQKSIMRGVKRQSQKMYVSAKETSARRKEEWNRQRQLEEKERLLQEREALLQEQPAFQREPVMPVNAESRTESEGSRWSLSTGNLPKGEKENKNGHGPQKARREQDALTERPKECAEAAQPVGKLEIPVIFPSEPRASRLSHKVRGVASDIRISGGNRLPGGEVREILSGQPDRFSEDTGTTSYINLDRTSLEASAAQGAESGRTPDPFGDPELFQGLHIEGLVRPEERIATAEISSEQLFGRESSRSCPARTLQKGKTERELTAEHFAAEPEDQSCLKAVKETERSRRRMRNSNLQEIELCAEDLPDAQDPDLQEQADDGKRMSGSWQEEAPVTDVQPETEEALTQEVFADAGPAIEIVSEETEEAEDGCRPEDCAWERPDSAPETHAASRRKETPSFAAPRSSSGHPAKEKEEASGQPRSGEPAARRNPRSSQKEIQEGIADVEAEMTKAAEAVRPEYVFPPLELLKQGRGNAGGGQEQEVRRTAAKLQQTLNSFGVHVTVTNVSCGPSVTRYELQPEQGVKVSRIVALSDDIKLNLAAADIRIEAPIPGKAAVGIEVPNAENSTVMLRDLLETEEFTKHKSNLAFAVGKDIGGKTVVADIAKMPHLLIAGATGSGKSVCINTLIMSILYKANPEDVKLIMVDPKVVELSVYNGIPHLFIPVVTDPKKAAGALNWAVAEMTDRYNKFAEYGVRDLKGYNQRVEALADIDDPAKPRKLPQIVIIVDELADLMMVAPGEVEDSICRLAQLARAAGIHLIIATQRPSVNVITGLIKANMPSRIAFSVSSGVDSRTIIDMNGAEKLLGKGDMLFYPQGYQKPARVQGAFVSDEEVSDVVDFLKNKNTDASYNTEMEAQIAKVQQAVSAARGNEDVDALFADAGKFIIEKDKASIGMLQRVFKIGFNRAARIMDQLSDAGVVGPEEGTKPRKILMSESDFENYLEQN